MIFLTVDQFLTAVTLKNIGYFLKTSEKGLGISILLTLEVLKMEFYTGMRYKREYWRQTSQKINKNKLNYTEGIHQRRANEDAKLMRRW